MVPYRTAGRKIAEANIKFSLWVQTLIFFFMAQSPVPGPGRCFQAVKVASRATHELGLS